MANDAKAAPLSRRLEIILTIYANVVFLVLWAGLAALSATNPDKISELWSWVGELPVPLAIVVWAVFLPIPVVLWIHESDWSAAARYAAYAGMVVWTGLALRALVKLARSREGG